MVGRLIAEARCASGNDNGNRNPARPQQNLNRLRERASENPENRRGGATAPSSKAELGS